MFFFHSYSLSLSLPFSLSLTYISLAEPTSQFKVASVIISSSALIALPKVIELQMDGADTFPIGNTLCCTIDLSRNDTDVVKHEGFITFFEQYGDFGGAWIRRRVVLDGSMLRCFSDGDVARGDDAQLSVYDLSKYPGAVVRKIPRSECARINSFAISMPDDGEHTIIKMAADSKVSMFNL